MRQTLRIVVASPSDVQTERDTLPGVLNELNTGVAQLAGLRLELSRWETDAYPGFHPEGPQGLIDRRLRIEDCDMLVGIFWKRFGTPTKDSQSGTEHEFRRAYETWQQQHRPQIMMYFNQEPATPQTQEETEQWGQVLAFRQQFPQEGLWWPYKGANEFEGLVRTHLTQFIIDLESTPTKTNPSSTVTQDVSERMGTTIASPIIPPLAGIDPRAGRPEELSLRETMQRLILELKGNVGLTGLSIGGMQKDWLDRLHDCPEYLQFAGELQQAIETVVRRTSALKSMPSNSATRDHANYIPEAKRLIVLLERYISN